MFGRLLGLLCLTLVSVALLTTASCKKSDKVYCKKCKECEFDATRPEGYNPDRCGETQVLCGNALERAEKIIFFVCEDRE